MVSFPMLRASFLALAVYPAGTMESIVLTEAADIGGIS